MEQQKPKSTKACSTAGCWVLTILVGLIMFATCAPCYIGSRSKAREAEVKANCHTIQIALERFAVDHGGRYPLYLYGGDKTDTFVFPDADINPDTGFSYYLPPDDPSYEPFPGDCDLLIKEGYISQYPNNPFVDNKFLQKNGHIITDPANNGFGPLELSVETNSHSRLDIFAQPRDRALEYVRRKVGGESGMLMWDISEGQRHPPYPIIIVPDPDPHWTGFINPLISPEQRKDNAPPYRDDHLYGMMPGNFYYYPIFGESIDLLSVSPTPVNGEIVEIDPYFEQIRNVVGFYLVGYGEYRNSGMDVYNLWGDFVEGSLGTLNEQASEDSEEDAKAGPDGRRDGVIITLSSGLDSTPPEWEPESRSVVEGEIDGGEGSSD